MAITDIPIHLSSGLNIHMIWSDIYAQVKLHIIYTNITSHHLAIETGR